MNILVISAHPDDETLGCGGTLLKHKAHEDSLNWFIATRSVGNRWSDAERTAKEEEVESVAKRYGMKSVQWCHWPTARLDMIAQAELIDELDQYVVQVRPELVYVLHGGDVHSDHRIVHLVAMSVFKAFSMRSKGVRKVLSYEILSSTEGGDKNLAFIPNVFCDITDQIDEKIDIFNQYQTEMQEYPGPREASAIRALARLRGATIGTEYAEGFMLLREVFF